MSDFTFSEISRNRLNGVDLRLIEIAELALSISHVDFGIPPHGGRRTAEEQNALFHRNLSKADGHSNPSYHQTGLALDVYAYVDGEASWNPFHLAMVATAMLQAASILGYQLEWGGLWSSNDTFEGAPYGWDMAHFQLLDND